MSTVITQALTETQALTAERHSFIKKTYVHLFWSILALVGIEVVLFQANIAQAFTGLIFQAGTFGWVSFSGFIYDRR